ncbi:TetR-like C-terminal domain-containing protein [Streptomyces sp. NPDC046866]|uniref:TetR-like C-terminal domain-containing protein n=1 Tax=Streptomyces sp. NPDC046866 TaxID=3154921 RepID=UPI003455B535
MAICPDDQEEPGTRPRREAGQLPPGADLRPAVEMPVGPLTYRWPMRTAPPTHAYADALVDRVPAGAGADGGGGAGQEVAKVTEARQGANSAAQCPGLSHFMANFPAAQRSSHACQPHPPVGESGHPGRRMVGRCEGLPGPRSL